MGFMGLVVEFGHWYLIETTHGTEIVPFDLIGPEPQEAHAVDFYCEGEPLPGECEVKQGWCARYSAPGFLDCTDWCGPYATREEAIRECKALHGDDEDDNESEEVLVRSSDEYTDEEGNTHSEWAPGRVNTVYLDVHTPDYQRAEAWADAHGTIDGSSWETAPDLGGLVYTITYDRPGLISDLEEEGYSLDLSEYTETPVGLIRTTYEIVTPESAEQGDVAESGWKDEEGEPYTLDEAIAKLKGCEPSSSHWHHGVWYTQADGETDYRTGAVECESYHLHGFGPEYERRVFECVTGRKVPRG